MLSIRSRGSIMNYEEILKCYNGESDVHTDVAYTFEIYDDLYYSLFHHYTEEANK